jgi:hypothetical protein
MLQPYGLPLDSRTKLTKTDWSIWSATLADNDADFKALISPIYDYLNQTTKREPLADSYVTTDLEQHRLSRAAGGGRPVHQIVDRSGSVEKVVHPRPHQAGNLGATATALGLLIVIIILLLIFFFTIGKEIRIRSKSPNAPVKVTVVQSTISRRVAGCNGTGHATGFRRPAKTQSSPA